MASMKLRSPTSQSNLDPPHQPDERVGKLQYTVVEPEARVKIRWVKVSSPQKKKKKKKAEKKKKKQGMKGDSKLRDEGLRIEIQII